MVTRIYHIPILRIVCSALIAALSTGHPAQGTHPAVAADRVEVLVQKALDNNPSLKSQRSKVQAAGQVPTQAGALPDPMADIEFMNISAKHPDLGDALSEGVSLGVTQTLPYPGKRKAAVSVAERAVEMESARLSAMESEIRVEVTGTAYGIAAVEELLSLNGRARMALEAASETAASAYASGSGTMADVVMAQAAEAKTLAEKEELETRKMIAIERLKSLLGGGTDESEVAGVTLPEPVPLPPFEVLLARLPEHSPEVLMARSAAEAEDAKVGAARLASRPDFKVGGRYRHKDMTMGGGDYLTASLGMTLPFFHRKDRYRPLLQEAIFQRESALHATDAAISEARYRLSEAYESAASAARLYRLYTEGLLLQAEQAYESSLSSYGTGKSDFSSVLSALAEMYEIMGSAVSAKGDYRRAAAEIEAVSGGALP